MEPITGAQYWTSDIINIPALNRDALVYKLAHPNNSQIGGILEKYCRSDAAYVKLATEHHRIMDLSHDVQPLYIPLLFIVDVLGEKHEWHRCRLPDFNGQVGRYYQNEAAEPEYYFVQDITYERWKFLWNDKVNRESLMGGYVFPARDNVGDPGLMTFGDKFKGFHSPKHWLSLLRKSTLLFTFSHGSAAFRGVDTHTTMPVVIRPIGPSDKVNGVAFQDVREAFEALNSKGTLSTKYAFQFPGPDPNSPQGTGYYLVRTKRSLLPAKIPFCPPFLPPGNISAWSYRYQQADNTL